MSKTRFMIMLGLAMTLWSVAGVSQELPSRPLRPTVSDFNIHLLNLELSDYRASVSAGGARSGVWSGGDRHRIAEWKPSKEVPAEVAAMLIEFWLEGGAVRLEVTAYLGKSAPHARPPDWRKLDSVKVASRLLIEDQLTSITETERFGIEPFSAKVSRTQPWSIGPPEVINKTEALSVTGLTEERPAYILTARNVSHKMITGVTWYGTINGRNSSGSWLNGPHIIDPGKVFEIQQRFNFAEVRDREPESDLPPKRAIVIAAIIFEDGTFEGEVDKAAELSASTTGQRIQFLRAIEMLRGVSLNPGDDQVRILSKLKRDITSLSEVADEEVVKELVTRYATASEDFRNRRMKEEVSNSLKGARAHVIQLIERFEFERNSKEADLASWLQETIQMLERSLGAN